MISVDSLKAPLRRDDFLLLLQRIDGMLQRKTPVLVAIDGNSAAGKSTLAAQLKFIYACNVFHMDDYFLQPFQRTQERLIEPGGNVDYLRFKEEVLQPLLIGKPFSYRPYQCATQELAGEVPVEPRHLNIIEGVYALHPHLSEAYDLKVFMEIEAEEQSRRLLKRSKEMYTRFMQEWIPMENQYFTTLQIASQCDLRFKL